MNTVTSVRAFLLLATCRERLVIESRTEATEDFLALDQSLDARFNLNSEIGDFEDETSDVHNQNNGTK